jgi:hypothetical protein
MDGLRCVALGYPPDTYDHHHHKIQQGAAVAHKFKQGYAYGLDPAMSERFAKEIEAELGYPVKVS